MLNFVVHICRTDRKLCLFHGEQLKQRGGLLAARSFGRLNHPALTDKGHCARPTWVLHMGTWRNGEKWRATAHYSKNQKGRRNETNSCRVRSLVGTGVKWILFLFHLMHIKILKVLHIRSVIFYLCYVCKIWPCNVFLLCLLQINMWTKHSILMRNLFGFLYHCESSYKCDRLIILLIHWEAATFTVIKY